MAINSMDTRIERKSRFKKKHIYSLIGIAVGLLCLLWLLFRDTSSSLKVEKERITIATVQKGEFNDYIRVIGQVLPDRIIYLDAIEGGRVEERLIEEGAQVRDNGTNRLSLPILRDKIKPDFSILETVLISTFSDTERAANFPTPFLPIFFLLSAVLDSSSVFREIAATFRYF